MRSGGSAVTVTPPPTPALDRVVDDGVVQHVLQHRRDGGDGQGVAHGPPPSRPSGVLRRASARGGGAGACAAARRSGAVAAPRYVDAADVMRTSAALVGAPAAACALRAAVSARDRGARAPARGRSRRRAAARGRACDRTPARS